MEALCSRFRQALAKQEKHCCLPITFGFERERERRTMRERKKQGKDGLKHPSLSTNDHLTQAVGRTRNQYLPLIIPREVRPHPIAKWPYTTALNIDPHLSRHLAPRQSLPRQHRTESYQNRQSAPGSPA
jgi:hypothetical protein